MTHLSRSLLFVAVAALTGSLYVTIDTDAQPRAASDQAVPPHWRDLAARLTTFYRMENVRLCRDVFTVDFVYLNPHLELGDKLYISGPVPGIGNINVSPISRTPGGVPWDHPWQNQTVTAYPTPMAGYYELPVVGVEPHDNAPNPPGPRSHRYVLEVTQWEDGCPSHVVFHGRGHGGIVVDDPGHAGALR